MSYWTDNAVMYAPHLAPLYGKQAIRELIEKRRTQPGYRIACTPCCAGIDERGGMAYTLGEGTVTLVDESGAPREHFGRYVSIWRKEEGQWRCAVKSWTPSVRTEPAGP